MTAEELRGGDGAVVATFVRDRTEEARWAILTPLRPAAEVAPAVLAHLRGHRVVTGDEDLVALLVDGGGQVRRRAHDYEYDLSRVPPDWSESPAPQGFRLGHDLDADALARVHEAAYPADHPDFALTEDHLVDMREMVAGLVVGPIVPGASWQLDEPAGPCGAILVVDRHDDAHPGRTWVIDVFVHPRHHGRGLGGLLLRRALAGAAAAGFRTTGLVVTEGNPARATYDALGFTHLHSGASVDLPR